MDLLIDFAVIEKHASRLQNVYTQHQWFDHVSEAVINGSCTIKFTEMQQLNF